jgi:hypothetical protein
LITCKYAADFAVRADTSKWTAFLQDNAADCAASQNDVGFMRPFWIALRQRKPRIARGNTRRMQEHGMHAGTRDACRNTRLEPSGFLFFEKVYITIRTGLAQKLQK